MDLYQLLDISQEPFLKTHYWIQEAKEKGAGLPHALNLASVSQDGQPSSRMVLLKRLSDEGLVFFTDYEGKKGKEINANNKAAMNFWWAKTDKQIRIEGHCIKVSKKESDDYFSSRPRGSQVSASASRQSETLESYEDLLKKANQIESENEGKEIMTEMNENNQKKRRMHHIFTHFPFYAASGLYQNGECRVGMQFF